MNIHEYQAKQVLQKYGVPVPRGVVCSTADEAEAAAKDLGTPVVVVKAQIHAGGRGKAGGVKVVKSPAEARAAASGILGRTLVTHQTGPQGKEVLKVYVEEGRDIARELYLGMVIDRATGLATLMASTEGGMEIEEMAAKTPEKILKQAVDPAAGFQPFHARKLAYGLGLEGDALKNGQKFMAALYRAFLETDASMLEINPLVVTKQGDVLALDAKMNFDNNALFRHKDLAALRDETEEDPRELEASKFDLSYISLDGSIGCMVNGAGLAMATMDIIKLHGAAPANFLDVGGGASAEQVTNAFRLILSDANVKAVLVNIFGGIMRCDTIAEGIIAAAKTVHLDRPLVVRLQGTNVDLGRKMLAESGLPIITAETMSEAAEKVVAAAKAKA
ncbi:MAG: ADP-forming succinate--CoA ligase subunit beta [Deferrisomatales bacterium]|nr:ADP-forming succinate--CoA ligase subunit beta [Deferrisomatales bacterium]